MTQKKNILIILGTRPEIIKLSPLIRSCEEAGLEYTTIHTGQHYSDNLDAVFFEQLELPTPEYNLEVGSQSHGAQTGEMLIKIEEVLLDEEPDTVVVQGDTNSVLAGAIATSKLDMELAHVEAGLRSFDDRMPEETNRVLTDHTADYLFAPTEEAAELLHEENIHESVYVTGNTVVDAVSQNIKLAEKMSDVLSELDLHETDYALMTAHRAENVDDRETFVRILDGVAQAARELGLTVVYPIHPRASDKLDEFDIPVPDPIRLIEPQDYLDFLVLERNASIIFTDSGGVQEEACILNVPCVTVRKSTERPETLDVGANTLAGSSPIEIRDQAIRMHGENETWTNPFGDGKAAEYILDVLLQDSEPQPEIKSPASTD